MDEPAGRLEFAEVPGAGMACGHRMVAPAFVSLFIAALRQTTRMLDTGYCDKPLGNSQQALLAPIAEVPPNFTVISIVWNWVIPDHQSLVSEILRRQYDRSDPPW